jgi:DNA-binding transcriptional LysR family regulator
MNPLELQHYRCLVTLAEELNFGRAAARLHMSQPPLTRIVAEVERTVGARLFDRTTRRVQLTPVGEVFIAEARTLLARADAALESVRAAARRESGQLRLSYNWLALQTVLPEILSALREREHEVNIDLIELSGLEQRTALADGHVDMGFTDEPIGDAPDRYVCRLLHREGLVAAVPDDHPLADKGAVRLADLARETFILHARHDYPRYYDRFLAVCQSAGFVPRVYHREARQNCIALVASGQGILLVPTGHPTFSRGGFRRVAFADTPPELYLEVWAALPAAPRSPALESLRAVIEARAGIADGCGPR